jgi:hypothetical protein
MHSDGCLQIPAPLTSRQTQGWARVGVRGGGHATQLHPTPNVLVGARLPAPTCLEMQKSMRAVLLLAGVEIRIQINQSDVFLSYTARPRMLQRGPD